ncbi:lytic transglycosylase domain-containing protein [Arboricoccus pini]|uniref:lytic transglycosylase domain-containing protein n=1 Tax=Arboricoccus pini TaxID=1963835 RepID=UPI0013FD924F|nr:lytic transglycosylase domain-containing protein [Arboricoccus pini]
MSVLLALVLAQSSPPALAQGDEGFALGRNAAAVRAIAAAVGQRNYAQAASLAAPNPLLRDWVAWQSLRDSALNDFASYETFLDQHPQWPDRAKLEANAEAVMGPDVDPARRLRWFATHPPRTRDGRERMAEALSAVGRTDEAANILVPLSRLPSPSADWNQRQRASREALDKGDYRRAYALAAGHGQSEGVAFAEGEWLAGWIALRFLNDPGTALGHFQRLSAAVTAPISVARGAYWSGRAASALGRGADARVFYARAAANPTTFYGQMAAIELGEKPAITPKNLSQPGRDRRRRFEAQDLAGLSSLFCASGLDREAAPFIRKLGADLASDPQMLEMVYDLARRCARPDLIVVVGKLAVQKGGDPLSSFPVPDVASLLSPGPGLPGSATLLGIARQESQFDSRVVSPAGAMGLIQIMPSTARTVAVGLGVPYDRAALTDEPEYNVQLGSQYLATQLDRFGGTGPLAFAAYNAGPARVQQWLDRYGDPRGGDAHTMIDWIESIPFNETRNYVQRVSEAETVYSILLREGGGRLVPLSGARRPVPGTEAPVPALVASDDDNRS